jgi:hypothetical protein
LFLLLMLMFRQRRCYGLQCQQTRRLRQAPALPLLRLLLLPSQSRWVCWQSSCWPLRVCLRLGRRCNGLHLHLSQKT